MSLRTEKILSLALWVVMVGFAVWGHFNLPDVPTAIHFDLNGTPNGFSSRDHAMMAMPGLGLAMIFGLLWIMPAIMPKTASLHRSQAAYGATMLAVIALLCVIHGVVVMSAAGMVIYHMTIINVGVGLLLIVMGNYLPKTRLNFVMGIRTPWTLSDERVWDKTHRFAGPMFMLGGVVAAAGAFLPEGWHLVTLLGGALVPAVISLIYSYTTAKKLNLV